MLKMIVLIFSIAIVPVTVSASDSKNSPVVSPLALHITAQRVGDVLFRYVEFFEGYPCLRLETFTIGHLKLIDRKEVCRFQTDRGKIDVTTANLTGVIYENLKLEKNMFHFSVDIIFADPGYYYANCKAVILGNGKLSEPACVRGERPPEERVMK